MNSIKNIEQQRKHVISPDQLQWIKSTSVGQLRSEYRGLVAHINAQTHYALEEIELGEVIESTRRSHAAMMEYEERLRLVAAELAHRVQPFRNQEEKHP